MSHTTAHIVVVVVQVMMVAQNMVVVLDRRLAQDVDDVKRFFWG